MDITNARGTNRIIYSRTLSRTPIHVRIRPKCTTPWHTLLLKRPSPLKTEVDTTIAGMHRLHWDRKDNETEVEHIRMGANNHTGVKLYIRASTAHGWYFHMLANLILKKQTTSRCKCSTQLCTLPSKLYFSSWHNFMHAFLGDGATEADAPLSFHVCPFHWSEGLP